MLSRLYHRATDFINCALTVTLLVGCIELVCLHSALQEDGSAITITIGKPAQEKVDFRLTELAAAIPARALRSH